jgi:hypothetical protein
VVTGSPPDDGSHHPRVCLDQLRTRILISSQAPPHELPFVTVQRACPASFFDETRIGATGFTRAAETIGAESRLITSSPRAR